MTSLTATEASRNFSALLDAVERGESITITRGNRPIAEIRPTARRTGRQLREALESLPPLDDDFADDVASATRLVDNTWTDPWDGS